MFKQLGFLVIGIICCLSCHAKTYEAFSVKELKTLLSSQIDENSLVVFDIDYTLIMPENPAFHRPNSWQHLDWIKDLQAKLTPDEWSIYPGIFMFASPAILINQEMPALLDNLQRSRVQLIALTGSSVGEVGPISNIENRRDEELRRLGIDFSSYFAEMTPTTFDELVPQRGYYPLFKNGILSTNGDKNTKGIVLKAFLDKIHWIPSKIIFVDDKLSYLKSVEEIFSTLEIEYTGIHYRAAEIAQTTHVSEEVIKAAWKAVSLQAKFYANKKNYIVIHAASHTLEIYGDDPSPIKIYSVGLGQNGIGKTKKGDFKTPIGKYRILWKASRYAEDDGGFLIAEDKAYCTKTNEFTTDSPENSGRGSIWESEYGGDQAIFMCLDYPNFSDQTNGYTGCGIAIHAASVGVGENSSAGCIRMTPLDARDLYNRVVEGAIVYIRGD